MRSTLLQRMATMVAVMLLAAACGGGGSTGGGTASEEGGASEGAGSEAAAAVSGSIEAADQDSDGTTITVSSVEISGAPGWIAVHSDVDGAPGPVLGTGQVEEGSTTDLVVTLDQPLTESVALWPMLHVDDNTVGTYEFGDVEGADLPVMADAEIVMQQIQVTVS